MQPWLVEPTPYGSSKPMCLASRPSASGGQPPPRQAGDAESPWGAHGDVVGHGPRRGSRYQALLVSTKRQLGVSGVTPPALSFSLELLGPKG